MGNGPVIVDKWKRKNPLQSMTLMTLWVPVPASSFPGCLQLHMLESCWFKLLYINWFSWFPWPFHLNLSTPCSSSILKCSYLLPEKHYIHFSFHFFVDQCKENHFANRGWRFAHLEKAFQASFSCSGSGSSPCLGKHRSRNDSFKSFKCSIFLGSMEKIPWIPSNLKRSPVNFPISPPLFPRSQPFFKNWYKSWLLWWCKDHGKKHIVWAPTPMLLSFGHLSSSCQIWVCGPIPHLDVSKN